MPSHVGVIILHTGIGERRGDLLEELVLLQHTLSTKRGMHNLGASTLYKATRDIRCAAACYRQVVDALRESANLPHCPFRVLHLGIAKNNKIIQVLMINR